MAANFLNRTKKFGQSILSFGWSLVSNWEAVQMGGVGACLIIDDLRACCVTVVVGVGCVCFLFWSRAANGRRCAQVC